MVKVSINHVPLVTESFIDIVKKETLATEEMINKCNRQTRRSAPMKAVASILAVISGLAMTSAVHAAAPDASPESIIDGGIPTTIPELFKRIIMNKMSKLPDQMSREDSFLWQMNKYMTDTLLKTHDFFTNPAILDLFHSISAITLSFTTLIIAKKGFDMIKAKMLGTSSLGVPELLIRMFCALVLMFVSLKVGSVGIALSNSIVKTFFGNVVQGFVPTELITKGMMGEFFWLITYILLFAVLGIRYWIRQINIVFLGLMAPVASLSWVSDGGAMIGSLIKEFIVYLTTPLAQGAVMVVGTVILTEVAANMVTFGGVISQILIGISTLCVAIITPDILNRFIQGSANPFAFALKTAAQVKSMPLAIKKVFK